MFGDKRESLEDLFGTGERGHLRIDRERVVVEYERGAGSSAGGSGEPGGLDRFPEPLPSPLQEPVHRPGMEIIPAHEAFHGDETRAGLHADPSGDVPLQYIFQGVVL